MESRIGAVERLRGELRWWEAQVFQEAIRLEFRPLADPIRVQLPGDAPPDTHRDRLQAAIHRALVDCGIDDELLAEIVADAAELPLAEQGGT